jgi:hypothetical protein
LLDEGGIERGKNKEVGEPQILKFHLEEISGFTTALLTKMCCLAPSSKSMSQLIMN